MRTSSCSEEFLDVLAMICDAKVPEENRGGEPFEYVLHSWLQIQFIPQYKRLLVEKKKNLVKSKIN